MATVVNNPGDGGASWGPAVVVLIVVLALIAFFVWGFPGGGAAPAPDNSLDVNIEGSIPTGGGGGEAR